MQQLIIRLILTGHTNREISKETLTCMSNVKRHITRIYREHSVKNRYELIMKLGKRS